jgi:hypothetical protein
MQSAPPLRDQEASVTAAATRTRSSGNAAVGAAGDEQVLLAVLDERHHVKRLVHRAEIGDCPATALAPCVRSASGKCTTGVQV